MIAETTKADTRANIGLVLDGTMNREALREVKSYANLIVDSFQVSDDASRFSVMWFGYRPILEFSFKDKLNADDVKDRITAGGRQYGVPRTDKALQDAADVMFNNDNLGDRSSLPKVLILLTTDSARSNSRDLDRAVDSLKKADIKSMVVVIGDGIKNDLKKIAPKEEVVFRVDDVDDLPETKDPVVDRVVNNANVKGEVSTSPDIRFNKLNLEPAPK